jgi:hypothetical protein
MGEHTIKAQVVRDNLHFVVAFHFFVIVDIPLLPGVGNVSHIMSEFVRQLTGFVIKLNSDIFAAWLLAIDLHDVANRMFAGVKTCIFI